MNKKIFLTSKIFFKKKLKSLEVFQMYILTIRKLSKKIVRRWPRDIIQEEANNK